VLGLQVFFELGLGFVVLQTVSHLMATVQVSGGALVGDQVALAKIGNLLVSTLKWYLLLCVCFVVVVLLIGRVLWTDPVPASRSIGIRRGML